MEKVFAQSSTSLGRIGGAGLGPFGNIGLTQTSGLEAVVKVVSSIIGLMTISATIWFIFQFLTGGTAWITAGGDKGKLKEARDRITHAFIGLIIVVAGWSILALAGQFFNFDILITNPGLLMQNLGF